MKKILALILGIVLIVGIPSVMPVAAVDGVSLFNNMTNTGGADLSDASGGELGVKFYSEVNGKITAIRYYKYEPTPRSENGRLWNSQGVLLQQVPFPEGTASGWQEAVFPVPVEITANTTYIASYDAHGDWHGTVGFFGGPWVSNGLHAPSTAEANGNGVYNPANGQFPTQTYGGQNYWVDVVFEATQVSGTQCLAPSLISHSDTNSSGGGQINIEWSSVNGVSQYVVQRAHDSGFITRADVTGTSFGGNDANDDPTWRVFANAGNCETPGKAMIVDP